MRVFERYDTSIILHKAYVTYIMNYRLKQIIDNSTIDSVCSDILTSLEDNGISCTVKKKKISDTEFDLHFKNGKETILIVKYVERDPDTTT